MTTTTIHAVRPDNFPGGRHWRTSTVRVTASLLMAMLAGLCGPDAAAQSQAQPASQANEAAADGNLHFWAVNEGGARIYRPDAVACLRIRGLSAQYADAISGRYQVPAYTLKIAGVRPPEGGAGCMVILDMPDGPRECRLGSVMKTFGGSYLAHTYAQESDGSVRYVAGDCR